jgi:predicted phage baseplate assembly protein
VGGETWTSATSFYGEGPSDRIYTEHLDDDDYTVVTFGDGVAGARLPTGSANVTATWRTGLGTAGNVDAGKIAQLRAKPLGVKGVTNPIAASGGADAEALEDIRANVPSAALLLDRLVSVSDYAAYANAFASIGLARADVLRVGRRRVITISALDSSGDPVVVGETLELALSEAITACKDAAAEFKVVPARIYTFNVSISVLLDDGQTAESVGIEDALAAAFAWTERDFHEGVTTSEVMAVVQALDGVKSVIVAALLMYDDADEYVEVSANRIDPPGASATDDGVYTGAALLVYKSDESTALSYIYQQGT